MLSLGFKSHLGLVSRAPSTLIRSFHITSSRLQDQQTSLFGEVTKHDTTEQKKSKKPSITDTLSNQDGAVVNQRKITVHNDEGLKAYIGHEPTPAAEKYLSPLKQQIYNANVAKNGFFKNGEIVQLPNGEKYKLELTKRVIEALEPSIYLKSYRIKSSLKKVTVVTKLLNRLNVKKAITQGHFTSKKPAKEIANLLQKGLKQASQLNLNPDELFIDQLWVGKDGNFQKRIDIKARGKLGIIEHPYVHIKAVLKTQQTKNRLAYEKQQKALKRKPTLQLPSESIRWRPEGFYKW